MEAPSDDDNNSDDEIDEEAPTQPFQQPPYWQQTQTQTQTSHAQRTAVAVATARALMAENPYNVFFGRGYPLIALHQGSLYKQLLKDNCLYYHGEVRLKNQFVERRMVQPIHDAGGTFYTWDLRHDQWVPAQPHERFVKVSQALRDEFKKLKKDHVDGVVVHNIHEHPGCDGMMDDGTKTDSASGALLDSTGEAAGECEVGAAPAHPKDGAEDRSRPTTRGELMTHPGDPSSCRADPREHATSVATAKGDSNERADDRNAGGDHDDDELLRFLGTSEGRIQGIREAVQQRTTDETTGRPTHDSTVKESMTAIDDGLTTLEGAVGIRRV